MANPTTTAKGRALLTPEAYALQLAVIRAAVDEGGARFADNIRAALTELERLDLGPRRSIGGSIPDAMRSRHAAGETVESLAWDFGWELADVLAVTGKAKPDAPSIAELRPVYGARRQTFAEELVSAAHAATANTDVRPVDTDPAKVIAVLWGRISALTRSVKTFIGALESGGVGKINDLADALDAAGTEQPERARCTGCYGCGECVPYPRQDA